MNQTWKCSAILLSLAFVWAGASGIAASPAKPAEPPKTTTKSKSAQSKMSDSEFARAAAEGGFAEVRLGELAEDKASNKTVKDLAQRMVTDHTSADDRLKSAASMDNIFIPTQLNARDQAAYTHLSQLSGAAFDRAYARDMVRDHEADIAAFRHEANDGKDASIKGFAAQTLPTLEDHLKLARQALESVSPKAGSPAAKKQS